MAATIWLFAKEFGWKKDYVLWEMSEAELSQLEHAILINKGINVRRATSGAENKIESLFIQ